MANKVKITGTVEEKTRKQVEGEAKRQKRSVSSIVRQSLHEYLDKESE